MRIVRHADSVALGEIAMDLVGLLFSVGVIVVIVFLAGGWI
jgi:hypothetical protein